MPVSLNSEAGTIPCTSGDWGERPMGIVPLNEAGERYWIVKIAHELNREIGLGLATAWSVGRTMSAVRRQEEAVAMGRVFAIGASNAGNTAAALGRKGVKCVPLTLPGCTVTRESVDGVMRRLVAKHKEGDIVLIQWLENSIFFLMNSETSSMEVPQRDELDGIFHVTGKTAVSKDMQLEALLEKLEPLLDWSPDTLKLLLCPLVRFLEDWCVAHPRGDKLRKDEGVRQLKELYQLRRVLKSWIIRKKYKNVILIDTLTCLGAASSLEKAKSIMADSYHLNGKSRETLAVKIKEHIVGWLRGKKRSSDTAAGGDCKRQKMDNHEKSSAQNGKKIGGAAKSRTDGGGRGGGDGKGRGKGGGKGRA
jgi:hypothetical protein